VRSVAVVDGGESGLWFSAGAVWERIVELVPDG
jgi:hypothetical protein